MRLQGERQVRGETLCEDVFSCFRQPGSVYNRIGLRRIAPCEDPIGPVVLFFPGVFMNGEIAGNDAKYDLRLYLAQAGLRVWSLDYRTHAVPSTASPKDLEVSTTGRARYSWRTPLGRLGSPAAQIRQDRCTWRGSDSARPWRTASRPVTTNPSAV